MKKGDIVRYINDGAPPDQLKPFTKGDLFKVVSFNVKASGAFCTLMHIKTARIVEREVLASRFAPALTLKETTSSQIGEKSLTKRNI